MVLGLLSDSIEQTDAVDRALMLLRDAGAEFLIHCGDIGGRRVLDALARQPSAVVFGDRDTDRMGLLRYAETVGIQCLGALGDFELDGKRCAVVHGHDKMVLRKLVDEGGFDVVLHGHASKASDELTGPTRVISPGPLAGTARSVAVFDTSSGRLEVIPV